MTLLPRRAGELLVRLLEHRRPVAVRSVLDEWDPVGTRSLIRAGGLIVDGHLKSMMVDGDEGIRSLDLSWDDGPQRYAYFDAADGVVVPDAEQVTLWSVHLQWWFRWLRAELDIVEARPATELVQDHAWDLGDLRIAPRETAGLIYARRLSHRRTVIALEEALGRHPRGLRFVLLTSSKRPLPLADGGRVSVFSISHGVVRGSATFTLDRERLIAPLRAPGNPDSRMSLSEDNLSLMIEGQTFFIRGKKQQIVLRLLVDAFAEGNGLLFAELRRRAELSSNSLDKVFRGAPHWPVLQKHLRREGGRVWLELV